MGIFLWVAAILSAGLAWLILFPLEPYLRNHAIDIPNDRSSHIRPTPRGGGLVIVALTLLGVALLQLLRPEAGGAEVSLYLVGALLIAGISWLDDRRSISNRLRFAVHAVGAILAVLAFGYWNKLTLPGGAEIHLNWIGLLGTCLWIVGLTNAYNFMDGIDGIAASQAVVAGTGWAILGWLYHQPLIVVTAILIAASSLGFLGHNWSPARIFMGDVGSAFLGYTFAVLPLMLMHTTSEEDSTVAMLSAVLLMWPFVFDTVFTFLRRLRNGENVFAAHRSHLYQRLVIAGYGHRAVTALYAGLASIGVALTLLFVTSAERAVWLIGCGLPIIAVSLWLFVSRQERRHTLWKVLR